MSERLCKRCGAPALPDAAWRVCAACRLEYGRQWRAANGTRVRELNQRRSETRRLKAEAAGRYCPRCRAKLSPNWKSRYCPPCSKEYRRELSWTPNRRCSRCGDHLIPGRISNYCQECDRAAYAKRTARARPCSGGCGVIIPAGRAQNYCPPCERQYRQVLIGRERPCSWCEEPLPLGSSHHLCGVCESVRAAERRKGSQPQPEVRPAILEGRDGS